MLALRLFLTFAKIGLLGFGGGLAIVTMIYDNIQKFAAMTQEEFANIVAISQITPGPLGVNVATYVGFETDGILGSLMATLGVALPAFIIVSVVARMVQKFQSSIVVRGALNGIRPATIGMIAAAIFTLLEPALLIDGQLNLIALIMCIVTVLMISKFKLSPIKVLLIMGLIGAVLAI